ncbi:ADP-ribosylglycohydrolase family protein [Trujillonella humicola]|uniref:ADP-ribosylglycohydrolase family protein n=1 Tax=Trujillonella humicola TaxID=3383699 RepID=UPI0039067D36
MRGLLLGLALGEALATGSPSSAGASQLRSGVGTQLALFTVEGLIRASVRQRSKGICHPPSVVWHALVRWAYGQGIPAPTLYVNWASDTGDPWPDGWLAAVPALRERRGSAPATVAALQGGTQGTRQRPVTQSEGYHGLIRALSVGALGVDPRATFELAADVAALTHGKPRGHLTAADGALIADALLSARDLHQGIAQALGAIAQVDRDSHTVDLYAQAAEEGRHEPGDAAVLKRHVVDRTAQSTLRAAVYVASSFSGSEQVAEALRFAALAAGAGVAMVTGALLGALHGVNVLPVEVVSRLELAWATDIVRGRAKVPAGGHGEVPADGQVGPRPRSSCRS